MDHFIFKATKLSCMYFFDAENKTELLILFGMVWNWPMGLKGNNIFSKVKHIFCVHVNVHIPAWSIDKTCVIALFIYAC